MGKTDQEVDNGVLKRVLEIQKLSGDDKEHILFTLDALLRDAKTRMAYA